MVGGDELIHLKNTVFPVTKLINLAKAAMQHAYAPYSNFCVGAALITLDGRIYSGCNVENASYGLACCAERVAIFKAVSDGIKEFKALAVIADTQNYCTPCGACRQVMVEFAPDMEVYTANKDGEYKKFLAHELLPYGFKL
ncbi:cytidine deaminase [Peptococcaceae bacterium]|nr:cytidine deaminase [Peptococcaceae bacterium]